MPKEPSAELLYARKLAECAKDTLEKAKALEVEIKALNIKMDKTAALARANNIAVLANAALANTAIARANKTTALVKLGNELSA